MEALADYGVVEVNDNGVPYEVHFLTEKVNDHQQALQAVHDLLKFYVPADAHVQVDEEFIDQTLLRFPVHVLLASS